MYGPPKHCGITAGLRLFTLMVFFRIGAWMTFSELIRLFLHALLRHRAIVCFEFQKIILEFRTLFYLCSL
jgi:hypothetical protein